MVIHYLHISFGSFMGGIKSKERVLPCRYLSNQQYGGKQN